MAYFNWLMSFFEQTNKQLFVYIVCVHLYGQTQPVPSASKEKSVPKLTQNKLQLAKFIFKRPFDLQGAEFR